MSMFELSLERLKYYEEFYSEMNLMDRLPDNSRTPEYQTWDKDDCCFWDEVSTIMNCSEINNWNMYQPKTKRI